MQTEIRGQISRQWDKFAQFYSDLLKASKGNFLTAGFSAVISDSSRQKVLKREWGRVDGVDGARETGGGGGGWRGERQTDEDIQREDWKASERA